MKDNFTRQFFTLIVIGIGLAPLNAIAQFNESAPWLKDSSLQSNKKKELSIDEMAAAFNIYWQTHDKTIKGSGYKPFKRWEYHWRNNAHPDGTLISPGEVWKAWDSKKKLKAKSGLQGRLSISSWQPVGPFNITNTGSWSSGQGRINNVYVDPNNANTVYVGTPAGGIWKSIDAGLNWTALADNLPQIGVSGIVTDPANSNIIYIATGDKDAGDTYSIGVLKSIDGGLTWNTTGLTFTSTSSKAGDIYIHPTNSSILWVATNTGLYKTTNAGVSWSVVLSGNIKDVKLKPGDPSTVYAVSTTGFYKSTDTGSTFTAITSGLPASSGRLVIDVTAANSQYVYVLSATTAWAFQGLYRSIDSGTTFTKTTSTTDVFESTQAWYDMALGVSQTNAELVFTGCLNVWKSANGGTSFTKVSNWSSPTSATYTHADIHMLRYFGDKLYCGSDGGVYVSADNGTSFTNKTTGLQIGQFYKIAVSKQSSGNMVGGLQDNGGHAYSSSQWKNYYGADGMDTGVDPNNGSKIYGFIQNGGNLYVSTNGGNSLTSTIAGPASGNWVTPLVVNSIGEVFAGYTKVYKLNGTSWIAGTTTFSSNIENVIVDPSNDNIMYVSDSTNLYKSTDKGVTFILIYTFPATIKDIRVHSSNSSIIYAVTQGTSGLVYQSNNGGTTFTNINTGLPSIGKNVIVHQAQDAENTLYLGTTLGVYYRDDSMSSWQTFEANLPNVSVEDLEINYVDTNLTAATFGRGVWRTTISTSASTDTTAPTAPTNLAASGTTSSSTNLTWNASTDNVGVTGYNVYNGTSLVITVQSTNYTVTGLAASTAYTFTVKARDAAGNLSSESNAVNVTTSVFVPTYCASIGSSVTDEYIGRVQLGTINNASNDGGGYSDFTAIATNLTKGVAATIIITPTWTGTIYAEGYAVWIDLNGDKDFDDAGELMWSTAATTATPVSGTFTVPLTASASSTRMRVSLKYNGIPSPCETFSYGEVEDYTVNLITVDTTPPSAPTNLTASGTTITTTNLSWTASTDNVAVTGYDVYNGVNLVTTVAGTTYTVTGLTANTAYTFTVKARDAAGNISPASNNANVTTLDNPDTTPPSAPTNLTSSGTTITTTNLSWTASTDNVAATGYDVYNGANLVITVAGTTYTVTGLTANTAYTFTVKARDAAGNISPASNNANVTTLDNPDTTPPSAPTNLTSSGTTITTTNLSWTASTDNVAATGYDVYNGANLVITVAGTTYTVTGLTANTAYTFTVKARDAAGNISTASNNANVTTLDNPDATPPSAPTNLTASGTTITTTNLSWTASTDNIAVTGYDVYNGANLVTTVAGTTYTVTGLTANTAYSFTVNARDAAGNISPASNNANVTTLSNLVTYCASQGNSTVSERIGKVVFGTINNPSTGTAGYENFTALSTNVTRNTAYTITITPFWPSNSFNEGYSVFIDYNRDGDFVDAGENVLSKSKSKTNPITGTLTIPATAIIGTTRMRVSMKNNATPTSCEVFAKGQVEDYTLNIVSVPEAAVYNPENVNSENSIDFDMFPNPVENILNVSFADNRKSSYKIFNINGQEIKAGMLNQKEINVSNLKSGIYFLELHDGQKTSTKKFIKK